MPYLKSAIAVIGLFLLTAVNACSVPAISATEQVGTIAVRVVVTQDFGQKLLLDRTLDVAEKSNALDALKQAAQVDTAYGGGFVESINGTRSQYTGPGSTRQDWFFYINGMEANTGALDYILHQGDVEQWDFHNWSFHESVPAIIGSFPGAFEYGYQGKTCDTIIAYADGLQEVADNLKRGPPMSGIGTTSQSLAGLSENEKESDNILLLGTADNVQISELDREWQRLGFFAYFDRGNLVVLDAAGHVKTRYSAGAGLIEATQNPWNPSGTGANQNVVWLISGTDIDGVKAATDVLLKHPDELKYAFAAVIANGKIIKLPQ